jgi:hypothetical protein
MMHVISVGWNCDPAIISVNLGLRPDRSDGYKTGPFDLMMSTHDGVVDCIANRFEGFIEETEVSERGLINRKYGLIFNHESPYQYGSALSQKESWSSPEFYTENDMFRFREKYTRRIQSFNDKLSSGEPVILIHQGFGKLSVRLDEALQSTYPDLRYEIIDITNHNRKIEADFLAGFGIAIPQQDLTLTSVGHCHPYNNSSMTGLKSLFETLKANLL